MCRCRGPFIHANLSKTFVERSATPGRIHPQTAFDVADLQAHLLPTYDRRFIYLNLLKNGELQYEPFRCLVAKDRLVPVPGA